MQTRSDNSTYAEVYVDIMQMVHGNIEQRNS